jgi:hypothetical protein
VNGCKDNLGAEARTSASCLTTFGLARTRYWPDIHEIYMQSDGDQMTVISGNKYRGKRQSVTVREEDGGQNQSAR